MSSWQKISSRQNDNYKRWRRWASHPEEADCPWVLIEGLRQISEVAASRRPALLLAAEGRQRAAEAVAAEADERVVLPAPLYQALSPLRSSTGIGAFFAKPSCSVAELTDCVLYLDGVADPGNLGTLIRSAAATGRFSVATAPGSVSFFNEKVVRSTAAALFRVPLAAALPLARLLKRGYQCWVAEAGAGDSFYGAVFEPPLVLVVGNEAGGLRQNPARCRRVHIPMHPDTDSLNAAVAGSLLLFEVYRRFHDQVIV